MESVARYSRDQVFRFILQVTGVSRDRHIASNQFLIDEPFERFLLRSDARLRRLLIEELGNAKVALDIALFDWVFSDDRDDAVDRRGGLTDRCWSRSMTKRVSLVKTSGQSKRKIGNDRPFAACFLAAGRRRRSGRSA